MCGLTGMAWTDERWSVGVDEQIPRMARSLDHRGPDSDGRVRARFADVAFKRLSIIDLEGGHQPLSNEDGSVEVLLNGEVYNHRQLRVELERKGHTLRTWSDVEVVPHLYEEYGDAFLEKLNGMFAVCLVDHARERLLLARDRLGIKPMYVALQPGGIVFGSEVKALLASGRVERSVDPDAVPVLVGSLSVPAPATCVPGVETLRPGELLVFDARSGASRRRWWRLPLPADTEAPDLDALDALLEDAIGLRLVADVPVGISLSGGVDSSLLTMYAARRDVSDLRLFTVHFEDTPRDEVESASAVAERFGLEHVILTSTTADFLENAPRMIWYNDAPIADPAYYAGMKVAEKAAEHVTVLLAGTGADELFAGYGRYMLPRKLAWLPSLPGPVRRLVEPLVPRPSSELRALREYDRSRLAWHAHCMSHVDPEDLARLSARLRSRSDPRAALARAFEEAAHRHPLDQQLYADTVTYLPDQLLLMQDRTTMGASIEGRVPFLDYRVVEAAFRIGGEHKLGAGKEPKALLRRLARGRLPDRVLDRPKLGFPNAVRAWMGGELGELLPRIFARPASFAAERLPGDWLARMTGSVESRRRSWLVLYAVFCLELWYEIFVTRGCTTPPEGALADVFELVPDRRDRRRRA